MSIYRKNIKKINKTNKKKDININDLHVLVSGPVPKELLRHLQKDQSINPDIKPSETKVKASGELLNWFHLLVAMFGLANRLLLPVSVLHACSLSSEPLSGRKPQRCLSERSGGESKRGLNIVWGAVGSGGGRVFGICIEDE